MREPERIPSVDLFLYLLKGSKEALANVRLKKLNELSLIERQMRELQDWRGRTEATLMLVEMITAHGEELIIRVSEYLGGSDDVAA